MPKQPKRPKTLEQLKALRSNGWKVLLVGILAFVAFAVIDDHVTAANDRLREDGLHLQGHVTQIYEGSRSRAQSAVTVEYTVDGTDLTEKVEVGEDPKYDVGEQVDVYVDRADSHHITINDEDNTSHLVTLLLIVLVIAGLGMPVTGVVMLVRGRKRFRRVAPLPASAAPAWGSQWPQAAGQSLPPVPSTPPPVPYGQPWTGQPQVTPYGQRPQVVPYGQPWGPQAATPPAPVQAPTSPAPLAPSAPGAVAATSAPEAPAAPPRPRPRARDSVAEAPARPTARPSAGTPRPAASTPAAPRPAAPRPAAARPAASRAASGAIDGPAAARPAARPTARPAATPPPRPAAKPPTSKPPTSKPPTSKPPTQR